MELVGRSCWPKQTSFGTPPARENWQLRPFSASQGVPSVPQPENGFSARNMNAGNQRSFPQRKVSGVSIQGQTAQRPVSRAERRPGTITGCTPSTAPGVHRASGGAVGRLPTGLLRGVPDPGRSNGPLPGGRTAENPVGRATEGWIPRRAGWRKTRSKSGGRARPRAQRPPGRRVSEMG